MCRFEEQTSGWSLQRKSDLLWKKWQLVGGDQVTRQHATNLEFFHIHSSIDNAALERSRVVYTKRKKENDWGAEQVWCFGGGGGGLSGQRPDTMVTYHFILIEFSFCWWCCLRVCKKGDPVWQLAKKKTRKRSKLVRCESVETPCKKAYLL